MIRVAAMRHKTIGFKAILLGLTVLVATGCPVFFPDPALEALFRTTLGKPLGLVTSVDLLQIKELDARNLGIRDITGIENCANLTWLDLDTNQISNLKPLEQLGRPESPFDSPLVFLNLDSNEITDITPLAGLLNLRQLSLFNNQIADISPLVTNVLAGGALESVILDSGTLNEQATNVDVPFLIAQGVNVTLATASSSSSTAK